MESDLITSGEMHSFARKDIARRNLMTVRESKSSGRT